ncbi:MAG: hypothetical protein H0U74_02645 [Bradymonadaceae bacterium]|nr:hypothetical protein [Lujinxingiaceae bacterium]
MKVLENNDERLVMREVPIALWLFGLMFLVSATFIFFFMYQVTTLQCQRVQGAQHECQLVYAGLLSTTEEVIGRGELKRAAVYTSRGDDSDTYRVELQIGDRIVPMTSYTSSGHQSKADTVNQINDFLDSPTIETLEVSQGNRVLAWIMFTVFGGIGATMLLRMASVLNLVIDVEKKQLKLRWVGLLKFKQQELALNDVVEAKVEQSSGSKGKSVYRVVLTLSNGSFVPLRTYSSSGSEAKQHAADAINAYLSKFSHALAPMPVFAASPQPAAESSEGLEW